MEKAHEVTGVGFDKDRIVLVVDGRKYSVALSDCSRKLLDASQEARRRFVVSASGYGIHWPDLDEDLSLDRLIGEAKAQPSAKTRKHGRRQGARAEGTTST